MGTLLYADCGFDVKFFEVFAVHKFFWANFIQKSVVLYLLRFSIEIQQTYISQNKLEETSQGCKNVLVNKRVFYCFYHFSFGYK